MNINVQGNTHLEGAIIASQAESQHNRFETGALSTKDIENYSELKTRNASISGGTGGINPMSALSLLGNKNESEHTTTKSAIGSNINIQLTQDPNAESTLQSLNRDTKNANQKVSKHNLQEIKETQELVKGIGEIADKAMQIYTHNEREKIEQAKLELGRAKAQNASEEEITQLNNKLNDLQKVYDKEYGTGSPTKRAVDAITAALQGLAAKDGRQALVGLASPYVNEQIKQYTGDNKAANLIAHALLGAVEAQITGNNALAGAVAGAGSEGAAMVIKNTLYSDKPIDQLSESEKQTITFLSQLAGGLAAGVVGDSAQSAAIGADIGRRAVENNYLKKQNSLEFEREMVECKKRGGDCSNIIQKYIEVSNRNFIELGLDKCQGGGVSCVAREEIVEAETNIALVKYDSNGRVYLGRALQDDETINIVKYLNGSDLTFLKNNITTSDRVLAIVMDPVSWPFAIFGARNLIQNNTKSNLLSSGIAVATNAGFQYSNSGKVEFRDLVSAGLVSHISAGKNFSSTANWNTIGGYYSAKVKGESPYESALLSRVAAQGGYAVGKLGENSLQPVFNPYRNNYGDRAWKELGMGISKSIPPNNIPSSVGSISGSNTSEGINLLLNMNKEEQK
ncbi:hypothetical protein GVX86_09375 [[Haemophilus] felis]|nr:hypothetical protein [[Haemophilus] felis]